MLNNQIKIKVLALLCLGFMISSCSKEDSDVQVDNYGFIESYEMQKNLNAGVHGCFELVFPINLILPDNSVIEITSFEDGKDQLQAWKEANPDTKGKPEVVFPVEIITEDGTVVSIADKSELKVLLRECKSNFPPRPRHFRPCFKLQYPLSLSLPDGSSIEVNSKMELKQALREWKVNNPGATERPTLDFPITIEYEDGTTQEIASKEDLIQAKKDCRE